MRIFDSNKILWDGSNIKRDASAIIMSSNSIIKSNIDINDRTVIKIFGKKNTGTGKVIFSIKNKLKTYEREITFETSVMSEKIISIPPEYIGSFTIEFNRKNIFGSIVIFRVVAECDDKPPLLLPAAKSLPAIMQSKPIEHDYVFEQNNIAIIIPYSIYGGAEEYIKNYLNSFSQKDNISVFCKSSNAISGKLDRNIDIIHFDDLSHLKTLLKRGSFKVFVYYNSLAVYRMLSSFVNKEDLIEIYHSDFIWPDAIASLNSRDGVSKIIRVSDRLTNGLKSNAERKTIPVGIDLDVFKKYDRVVGSNDNIVIGCVARLSSEKNIEYILELASKKEDYKFVIIGDGPKKESLLDIINRQKMTNVKLLGHKDDVYKYYSTFDAIILPSLIEGTPISLMEAMASECPVFATNVGSVSDLIIDNVTGKFLTLNVEQDLKIISDNLKNKQMIDNAKRKIHEIYNLNMNLVLFEDIFLKYKKKFVKDYNLAKFPGEFI